VEIDSIHALQYNTRKSASVSDLLLFSSRSTIRTEYSPESMSTYIHSSYQIRSASRCPHLGDTSWQRHAVVCSSRARAHR
jgi:hypothetical protein